MWFRVRLCGFSASAIEVADAKTRARNTSDPRRELNETGLGDGRVPCCCVWIGCSGVRALLSSSGWQPFFELVFFRFYFVVGLQFGNIEKGATRFETEIIFFFLI